MTGGDSAADSLIDWMEVKAAQLYAEKQGSAEFRLHLKRMIKFARAYRERDPKLLRFLMSEEWSGFRAMRFRRENEIH